MVKGSCVLLGVIAIGAAIHGIDVGAYVYSVFCLVMASLVIWCALKGVDDG